jgi:hypothetical protein
MTHGPEKSDLSTVAMKLTNKIGQPEPPALTRVARHPGRHFPTDAIFAFKTRTNFR